MLRVAKMEKYIKDRRDQSISYPENELEKAKEYFLGCFDIDLSVYDFLGTDEEYKEYRETMEDYVEELKGCQTAEEFCRIANNASNHFGINSEYYIQES